MASRRKSELEEIVLQVLKTNQKPLSLEQIVKEIQKLNSSLLNGPTPKNTLYAMIYKRENRRALDGDSAIFIRRNVGRSVFYTLMDNIK